jgi:enoyl-CoA hydratase
MSPSSVLWSFDIVRRGSRVSLRDALQAELRMTRHVSVHSDFIEGVRAMLVDKDRKPRWNPARIEDVDPATIAAMFDD